MPDASLIISTYNRPSHLARCLEGFRHQSAGDFEILVADDGSGAETAALVRAAARDQPRPVRHVWQEDRSFRKCKILNQASRLSASDYLIYTDADCVPHRDFVAAHLRYRAPGRFLVGRCVRLSAARSAQIELADIASGRQARVGPRDIWDNLRRRTRNLPYGIRLPGDWSFRLVQLLKKNRGARGGNLSLWKSDLVRVNGWNEDFESWGLEDVELGQRLGLAGVEPVLVVNKACTFHLYHPAGDKKSRSARIAYDASKARGLPWCPNGLVKSAMPAPADARVSGGFASGSPRSGAAGAASEA
jgi:glycosyltransferase involved in cell wall biosynthesis